MLKTVKKTYANTNFKFELIRNTTLRQKQVLNSSKRTVIKKYKASFAVALIITEHLLYITVMRVLILFISTMIHQNCNRFSNYTMRV